MFAIILALRKLAGNPDVIWLIQQALTSLAKIADGETQRKVAAEFAREAEVRAKVLSFDEAMKRIPKR